MGYRYGGITYAQHGEDIAIVDIFAQLGIERPTYLDLGAHRPDDISNTKLLYDRGSRGVNVEANPNLIALFHEHRPEDLNICAAVVPQAEEGQKIPFYMFDDWSGLNTFSKRDADIFKEQSGMPYEAKMEVEGVSLSTLFAAYFGEGSPDFLNCDVEGYDYAVLSEIDSGSPSPIVVCAEVRMHDSKRFSDMMRDQDYRPHTRMGENILYVRADMNVRLRELRGL